MAAGAARHLNLDYRTIAGKMLKGRKSKRRGAKDVSRIANISAVASVDGDLWTASDEGASLERLKRGALGFAHAQNWDLAGLFPAFAGAHKAAKRSGKSAKRPEADLEGLAFDAAHRRLWIIGSHCRGRGSAEKFETKTLRKGVKGGLDAQPLRTLLGFVVLADDGSPVEGGGLALPLGEAAGSLRASVKADGGHLAEALQWPSKENGLDIEGIAVKDTEVLLGLRGPAAGGFAVVMRLSLKIGAKDLSLRKRNGARYALSFLQLNGLGVRDLHREGDDVLVLAGPTMDLDAPFALYRWRGAFARAAAADEMIKPGTPKLEFLFDFTSPKRTLEAGRPEPFERPEGIALLGGRNLIVVHDRPFAWRLQPRGTLKADLLDLAGSAKLRRPLG